MIAELLKEGKINAIPAKELSRMAGCTSVRELQEVISRERAAGQVILSTTQNGGGYYLPASREEVLEFCRTLESRAKNTFSALRSARAYLNRIPGQEELELGGKGE